MVAAAAVAFILDVFIAFELIALVTVAVRIFFLIFIARISMSVSLGFDDPFLTNLHDLLDFINVFVVEILIDVSELVYLLFVQILADLLEFLDGDPVG